MTAAQLPSPGSPAWYALEAEQHLNDAEKFVKLSTTSLEASAALTHHLLAATASAQLGLLKISLQQNQAGDQLEQLHEDLTPPREEPPHDRAH